jgi:hypothetical protein
VIPLELTATRYFEAFGSPFVRFHLWHGIIPPGDICAVRAFHAKNNMASEWFSHNKKDEQEKSARLPLP